MNPYTKLVIAIALAALAGCTCQKEVEKFTEEKPLAVEVTRARSYYHARDIRDRLQEKGLQPYIVTSSDSTEGGAWYKVIVGAHADSAAMQAFRDTLKARYGLDSLRLVDYRTIKEHIAEVVVDSVKEEQHIEADRPGVPQKIYDVITKFPKTNMFYVQQMYVLNAPEKDEAPKRFAVSRHLELDLPRGISRHRLMNLTVAFAEAVYEDNIYGDRVTLDILKLKPDHGLDTPQVTKAGFWPVSNASETQLAIAGFFADLILNTGEYATEEKTEIEVVSFSRLVGYKTVIEPKPGYFRTYLILVDETGEYAIFCQSTDKTEEDLFKVLKLVGTSRGLLEYDEFYNTFFTLPGELDSSDTFVGFYIDKLDWRYAKQKDYEDWAKECVGHWAAQGLFYSEKKGPWSYGIFDLLTEEKARHEKTLYSAHESKGKARVSVYGTDGFFVSRRRWKENSFELYWHPWEVNFTIKRYVCMVDNIGATWLTRDELVAKAERFQFEKGGFREIALADTLRAEG
ncbi:MAG: SPOR domain-containing protein [bacterium]